MVFDGYPLTRAQVDLMERMSIIPHRMLKLDVSSEEVMVRATKMRNAPERFVRAALPLVTRRFLSIPAPVRRELALHLRMSLRAARHRVPLVRSSLRAI